MIDFEEDILSPQSNVSNSNSEEELWVCRYRPRTLEHFCLDEKLKNKFKNQIETNNIQNCALIGTQGIGKTTLALILANSSPSNDILFIPCAVEGKIETIQSKIVPFCQSASRGRKIIILDELDSASATQTNSFQKSLRNICEIYKDCRFIATANYQQNIIPPILSRLPPVSLTFSVSDMINNLIYILSEEKVEIVSEATKVKQFLGSLIKSFYPDMRLVISQLQTACICGKLDVDEVVIDSKDIVRTTLSQFLMMINSSGTPLELRKAYNNEVLSFGNNGNLARLCSPYGLAQGLFNHIVDNFNANTEDLMELVEYMYKIEHSIDGETMLFGFLLKVKSMNLTSGVVE